MPIETTYVKGELEQPMKLSKTVTHKGVDIIYCDGDYNGLYNLLDNTQNFNIIDYQCMSEINMAAYTRAALDLLPKKDYILIGYLTEALNSVYWNVVFDIIKGHGYKKIIWVDGGLTPGYIYAHLINMPIVHRTSTFFFQVLSNNLSAGYPTGPKSPSKRTYYYLSLGRLARKERIYFTKKILDDNDVKEKGIYSCGWGEDSVNTTWNKNRLYDRENLLLFLNENDIKKFPVSLGHHDNQQHFMMEKFDQAVINVVQESSYGFDHRSHEIVYKPKYSYGWCRVNSDRLFFTEKSAKPFLTSQLPLFIAAPGFVDRLRTLGFDMFDDIIDHSYDQEDYIFKRCDMVFDELKRLTNLYTLDGWNAIINERLTHRFHRNFMLMKELSNDGELAKWINSNLV